MTVSAEKRVTWLAYSCLFVEGINVGWFGPFLPDIARSLSVSIDRAGLIVSAAAAGYFMALIAGGEVVERRSARTTIMAAMTLIAAGLFALAFATGLPLLLCGAFLTGLGAGACDVASNALVANLNPHRLTSALNYLHLAFGVGALLGPIIAGFALKSSVSYSSVFAGGGSAAALVAISLSIAAVPESRRAPAHHEEIGSLLTRPVIWAIAAVLFFYVGVENGIGAWLFSYLRVEAGFSPSVGSWTVSLYWLGLVLGRGIGGRLGHSMPVHRATITASILAALALIGLILVPQQSALAALMALLIGIGFGPVFPNMIAVGAARFGSQVGRMTSIVAAAGAAGGIVGPWLMGRTLVLAGPQSMMEVGLAIIAAMLASVAIVEWLSRDVFRSALASKSATASK